MGTRPSWPSPPSSSIPELLPLSSSSPSIAVTRLSSYVHPAPKSVGCTARYQSVLSSKTSHIRRPATDLAVVHQLAGPQRGSRTISAHKGEEDAVSLQKGWRSQSLFSSCSITGRTPFLYGYDAHLKQSNGCLEGELGQSGAGPLDRWKPEFYDPLN